MLWDIVTNHLAIAVAYNRGRLDPQSLSTPPEVWAGNPVWQGLYTFRTAGCLKAGSGVATLYALGTCQNLVFGRAIRRKHVGNFQDALTFLN